MKELMDTDYHTAVLLEAVRYAELERDDLLSDEYGMMIRSIWQFIDPLKIETRKKSVNCVIEDKESGEALRFTSHSHEREPLTESYDDILVYRSMLDRDKHVAHYIIDRFCPKKIY